MALLQTRLGLITPPSHNSFAYASIHKSWRQINKLDTTDKTFLFSRHANLKSDRQQPISIFAIKKSSYTAHLYAFELKNRQKINEGSNNSNTTLVENNAALFLFSSNVIHGR